MDLSFCDCAFRGIGRGGAPPGSDFAPGRGGAPQMGLFLDAPAVRGFGPPHRIAAPSGGASPLMPNPDPKKRPAPAPVTPPPRAATGRAPAAPPPPVPPAVKKEDISRWEGEGGAPATGSQGRSKDGSGTGKVPPPLRKK